MTSDFYVALSHFNYLLKTVSYTSVLLERRVLRPIFVLCNLWVIECRCREYRLYAVYGRWIRVYLHIRIIARRQHNPMRCDLRFSTPRKPRIVVHFGRDSEGADRKERINDPKKKKKKKQATCMKYCMVLEHSVRRRSLESKICFWRAQVGLSRGYISSCY